MKNKDLTCIKQHQVLGSHHLFHQIHFNLFSFVYFTTMKKVNTFLFQHFLFEDNEKEKVHVRKGLVINKELQEPHLILNSEQNINFFLQIPF